jgi:hypothetical protein
MIILYGITVVFILYFLYSYFLYRKPHTVLWIKEFIAKKEHIIKSNANSNNIIFAGGSSTLFGINTNLVGNYEKYNLVNFGIASGLQPDYYFHILKKNLKSGDMVILPLEYSFFAYDGIYSEIKNTYIRTFDRKYFNSIPILVRYKLVLTTSLKQIVQSFIDIVKYFINKKQNIHEAINYNPKYLDKNGNQVYNKGNTIFLDKFYSGYYSPIDIPQYNNNSQGLESIIDLHKWCKDNNIECIVSFAATVYFREYTKKKYRDYFEYLLDFFNKHNVKVFGDPYQFFYKPNMFFDSRYHLNNIAAKENTSKFDTYIGEYLNERQN